MAEFVKIEGLRELQAKMQQMAPNIARNGLRAAVSAGAAVIRDEARQKAPVDTGEMKRDIMIKRERTKDGNDLMIARYSVYVRAGKKSRLAGKSRNVARDSYYWRFIEFGHFTRPAGGGTLARHSGRGEAHNQALSEQVQSGQVRWVPAQPFMRPAFESKKGEALEAIKSKLASRIAEETKK